MRVRCLNSCKESTTEEWLCEVGICAYYGTLLYLPHTIHAHPSIGYYMKQMWTGWFVCFNLTAGSC